MAVWITWALGILFGWKLWSLVKRYVLMPWHIRACFLKQGIKGPPPIPFVGSMLQIADLTAKAHQKGYPEILHDILDHAMPEFTFYTKQYGKIYLFWYGNEPRLVIHDPDMVRDVFRKGPGHFGISPQMRESLVDLTGNSILISDGEDWAQRRRILNPAFQPQKLKAMVGVMANCTLQMVERWEVAIQNHGSEAEIEVLKHLACLTGDIISHTAFGSSYKKGQKVLELLQLLPDLVTKLVPLNLLPGGRLLPFPINLQLRNIKKEVNSLLGDMVKERRNSVHNDDYGHDLLGLMLREAAVGEKSHGKFGNEKLIEDCQAFYLAGHETTSYLLSWCLMLLAKYPVWQDLARSEVQEVCKGNLPDAEMLGKLKTVTMVINETLRLYPPSTYVERSSNENIKLGKFFIPKGTVLFIPIVALHHDPSLWGPDVNEFNPNRFADGIENACIHPMAFIPFVSGPRVCIGQAFATLEAKTALTIILSRFKFHLSSSYIHNPGSVITLKPLCGMPLMFQKLI